MTSNKAKYLPSVGRLLGFASADCSKLSDRLLKKHGLTLRQWIAMTALWRGSSMSESDLADYCRMSPSSLNRLIDRMEAKHLVRRTEDPSDRRRILVIAGPRGRKLSHLLEFYSDINDVLLKGMTSRERAQLDSLLERVISNLEAAIEDR